MDDATRMVMGYFEKINRIPRCSKQEQQISRWLQGWAEDRGLPVKFDPAGNMLIQVPSSKGFEQAPTIILQGHLDMVCEKHAGSDHDFSKDPIRMVQDGPWLTARDTTLGADNGIAIAMAMAVADHPEVRHPPLELYFTVEEETGLTGVLQMDPTLLSGKLLINLDSEDEGVFVIGCAGGRNTTINRALDFQNLGPGCEWIAVSVHGLQGGHSGVDIAKHRANANTVMARLLGAGMAASPIQLVELKGGTGRNVIPRACDALVACQAEAVAVVKKEIGSAAAIIKQEYSATDPGLTVLIEQKGPVSVDSRGVSETDTTLVVNLLRSLPSGPAEMSLDFPLLVQTSSNLSLVEIDTYGVSVTSNQRSSVPSRLDALCLAVEAVGRLAGATVHTGAGYPSWPANNDSPLLKRCMAIYRQLFETDPTVQVMHAGLECGVIGDRCPGMDMISLGPTMENPHSPSERLYLPSVAKVWRLMVALLESFAP